ncbi:MAG: cytochrome-c peroxidase [Chitinophagaceae bacterium]|nr:cytochrome-c peroxidase [Chitinophagaceae bacterium]
MFKSTFILFGFGIVTLLFSFSNTFTKSPSENIKTAYLNKLDSFITTVKDLQVVLNQGDPKKLQSQFLRIRSSYKKVEVFIEYYFDSYATVLNGSPIPFFDERESYKLENAPLGMQVIEGLIFPEYQSTNKSSIQYQLDEMLRQTKMLPTVNEPFEFNDANIFDAFVEEMYRITALGLTGFDSQTAQNSLPECADAMIGLQEYLSHYENLFNEKLNGKYEELNALFNKSYIFLKSNNNFNTFNRLVFIQQYLNPITKIMGEYKTAYNLADNNAGQYYSAVKKNGTLFNEEAFNPFRFLDDFTTTPQKVEFGRLLFFEKQLSSNNKQSCAGCHQPNKAFTDGLKTSAALDGHSVLKRNAPTLWNAALQRNLFMDSRSRNLEDQILQVLNNSKEMHGSAKIVAKKILSIEKYKNLYNDSYPNAKADDTVNNICNAIACYERTLIALNSKFDRHMKGGNLLSKNEINGFNLFMGKAKCGTCHFMPLFSGAKPPRYYYIESEVIGVPANASKRKPFLDSDSGRYLITQIDLHLFSFKTPTLRNIAATAPYMHNGVFTTLEDVVEFYNKGGGKGLSIAPKNQTLPFDKLNLNSREKKDIVLFMKALTDTVSKFIATD